MGKLKKYFQQPYPLPENNWPVIISVSVFIGAFLVLFQPFGLSRLQVSHKELLLGAYGFITFFVVTFFTILLPLLFPVVFKEEKWTFSKQYILLLLLLFCIGAANFVYSRWVFSIKSPFLPAFLSFQFFTFIVGAFPVTFVLVLSQNRKLKAHLKHAAEVDSQLQKQADATQDEAIEEIELCILAENQKDQIRFQEKDFIYTCAEGNYLNIFLWQDGQVQKNMIRSTLKSLHQQLEHSKTITQCHRAFMVNLQQIEQTKGNAQGLQLKLKGIPETIPVSRSFVPVVKEKLTN